MDQSSRRTIRELKESVALWESRCSHLEGSERMANERANSAADNIARLQREIKTLEASREANNNAELARNKATLADLERAVTDARRNESEARLSLQEATERYEAKIHQLERDNAIANEMAKVNSKMMDLIHHLAYEIVNNNNFVDIRGCSRTS